MLENRFDASIRVQPEYSVQMELKRIPTHDSNSTWPQGPLQQDGVTELSPCTLQFFRFPGEILLVRIVVFEHVIDHSQ